mmetsp:Transcript_17930/g.29033  ORF Transcript_17930/g.29033 Transcript_17930/m.29033 type:complete len:120 (+) Transcript_17930:113-472(+)
MHGMAIAIPSGMLWRAMPSVTMDASEDGDEDGDDNGDIGGVCSTDAVGLSSIVGDGSRMEGEIISGGGNVDLLGFTFFSKAIALDEIMGLEVEGSNNIASDVVEAGVIGAILTTDDDDD